MNFIITKRAFVFWPNNNKFGSSLMSKQIEGSYIKGLFSYSLCKPLK